MVRHVGVGRVVVLSCDWQGVRCVFFSSRRRHTRFDCDWSSDVCSSDLDEAFALGAQWRRAAYSVSLNIAEGATQSSPRQFRRYLEIAKGSLDELQGVLELARLTPIQLSRAAWNSHHKRPD